MRLRSLLLSVFRRLRFSAFRRRTEPRWNLSAAEVQQKFDQIRCAMPVDDEELAAAKPITRRFRVL